MTTTKKRRARHLRRVLITCSDYRLVASDFGVKFSRHPSIVLERQDGFDAMRARRWKLAPTETHSMMLVEIGRELLRRGHGR